MNMNLIRTHIPDVLIVEPRVFGDSRGFFLETYNQRAFADLTGISTPFVQDNHSRSARGVVRGLHYQIQHPQGKLVRVAAGEVYDVAVDLRRSSPTFKQWVGARISQANNRQIWIPPGFAHGFLVLSEYADFLYKVTDYYHPPSDRSMKWNDPTLNIRWPLDELGGLAPSLSAKDLAAPPLEHAEVYP